MGHCSSGLLETYLHYAARRFGRAEPRPEESLTSVLRIGAERREPKLVHVQFSNAGTLMSALGGKRTLALAGLAGLSGLSSVMMQFPYFPVVAAAEWKK